MSSIVTYYSYKGGVGRTFALANTAVLLAKMGKRVLMMDWDLEAPGLHRYFEDHLESTNNNGLGLIHLLHEAAENPKSTWKSYLSKVTMPDGSKIDLLPSGDEAPDYVDRVSNFSWNGFFKNAEGGKVLDKWRAEWKSEYDFVLLDSRTGITDAGGVCTIYLPDVLVLAFTANEQSFSRGIQVVTGAQKARRGLSVPRAPLTVLPLPGKFDGRDEIDDAQKWMSRFSKDLKPFYDDWLPKDLDARKMLEMTKIPYIAKFSFGEPLPVITQGITDPEFPGFYLQNVTDLLVSDFGDARRIVDPDSVDRFGKLLRSVFSSDDEIDEVSLVQLMELLRSEEAISPDAVAALSEVAIFLTGRQRYVEAESLLLQSLEAYSESVGSEHPLIATTMRALAGNYRFMGRLEEALSFHERALSIDETSGSHNNRIMLTNYINIAGIHREQGDLDAALEWYKRALSLYESSELRPGIALLSTYNNIAGVYRQLGDLDAALDAYKQAQSLYESSERRPGTALLSTYNNIAGVYRQLGDLDAALDAYKQALSIYESSEPRPETAILRTYNNLAKTNHQKGDLDAALKWYQRSFELKVLKESPDYIVQLMRVALVLLDKKEPKKAEKALLSAYEAYRNGHWSKGNKLAPRIALDLAALLSRMGYEKEALTLTERTEFDVFISYNHADSKFVQELSKRITRLGLNVWFDQWSLPPGSRVNNAILDALNSTASVLHCVGSSPSQTANRYLEEFLAQSDFKDTLIIPVLLPNGDLRTMPDFLHEFQLIDLQSGISDSSVHRIVDAILDRKEKLIDLQGGNSDSSAHLIVDAILDRKKQLE